MGANTGNAKYPKVLSFHFLHLLTLDRYQIVIPEHIGIMNVTVATIFDNVTQCEHLQ